MSLWRYEKLVRLLFFFAEPNAKVNVKYYCNVLLKKMIPEMNNQAKHTEYLFMQDGARAHTAKLTLEMLKEKKKLRLLEHHHCPANSPELNPEDCGIWRLLEQNVYRGQRITDLNSLKEVVVEEWNKIPQEIIGK